MDKGTAKPAHTPKRVSLRSLALLAILIAFGFVLSFALRNRGSVGEDIADHPAFARIVADTSFPTDSPEKSGHKSDQTSDPQPELSIVVFTDYGCPACRGAAPALERAISQYREKGGTVRVSYRDWPIFGPDSEQAARYAIASDKQGVYPAMHAALMQARNLSKSGLQEVSTHIGADPVKIEQTLDQESEAIEATLEATRRDAFQLALRGTPAYLIGPILIRGAVSEAQFSQTISHASKKR